MVSLLPRPARDVGPPLIYPAVVGLLPTSKPLPPPAALTVARALAPRALAPPRRVGLGQRPRPLLLLVRGFCGGGGGGGSAANRNGGRDSTPLIDNNINNIDPTAKGLIELRAADLRSRRAARVLVVNPAGQVLLFEYSHAHAQAGTDALADKGSYYTTPGGGVKPGESFAECARRELLEETGIAQAVDPRVVAVRRAPLVLPSGEVVIADERYFAVRLATANTDLDFSRWSAKEKRNIKATHWCTPADLHALRGHNLWPSTLNEILAFANATPDSAEPLTFLSPQEQIGETIVRISYT